MYLTSSEDVTIIKSIIGFAWNFLNIEFTFAGITFTLWGVIVSVVIICIVIWLLGSQWSD